MEHLPLEILDLILSYLDIQPPSEEHLFDRPSPRFFHSDLQPLKCISLTSQRFRKPAAELLFKHVVMDASHDSSRLFLILNNLKVNSISVLIHSHPFADHPASIHQIQGALNVAMGLLDATVVTLAVSPTALATIMRSDCYLGDAWAFQIPFQVLRLEGDSGKSDIRQRPSHSIQDRPWSQVTFNEGSAVPVYSTYEHFHREVPSWIHHPSWFSGCLQNLTVFEYITVFPLDKSNNLHVVGCMSSLRTLRVQLAPSLYQDPDQNEDDAKELKLIQDNHKDMWWELQKFLVHLADRIENDWSSLPLSTVDFLDYRNGAREVLFSDVDDKMVSWTRHGGCSWIKSIDDSD